MITRKRVFISCLFYVIVLVWIISFKMNMEQAIFECMYYFGQFDLKERFMISLTTFKFEGLFNDWKDVLVNMCFFMPVGVYCFELIKKHRFLKGLGIAFLLTLLLETIQLITTVGYFTFNDLDDCVDYMYEDENLHAEDMLVFKVDEAFKPVFK